MDLLDIQSLAGGPDSAAQRLVLSDLDIQRCLRCDGGLSRLGGLFLQIYVATMGQKSNSFSFDQICTKNINIYSTCVGVLEPGVPKPTSEFVLRAPNPGW